MEYTAESSKRTREDCYEQGTGNRFVQKKSAEIYGRRAACRVRTDLILLDINMPDIDGLTLCQKIRELITCPILFLTARVESADKIIGFQAGADDYIIKPFDLDELGARVAAHLRREQRHRNKATIRFFGELTIDYSARTVTVAGEPVALSKREFDIVELLSLNAGQVFVPIYD